MNKRSILVLGILAVTLPLILTGCPDPNNGDAAPKTVQEKYRFSSLYWCELTDSPAFGMVDNSNFALGKDTLIVTVEGEVIASYTGVYTAGGGTHTFYNGSSTGPWSYLYAASGKIGIAFVIHTNEISFPYVILGKTSFTTFPTLLSDFGITMEDIADMQDDIIGSAYE